MSPALCPKYCPLLCVYMDLHTSKAAESYLPPTAPPGANTEESARDRQKCAQLSYSHCLCAAPLLKQEEQMRSTGTDYQSILVRTSCPPILRTDDLGLELKPGFGHITLISDVRQHCCSTTADRSLGLKKVKFWGRRKLSG